MPAPFEVELSMAEAPSEAQSRAVTALEDPAGAVGLRLSKRGAGQLDYRPKPGFPFLRVLYRNLTGEKMTVRFEPGSGGGSRVTIKGAVGGRARQEVAADPDHWSEALGASASPAGGEGSDS
jgi:hypothetical protein